jgi:hypothetical protein
MTQQRDYSGEFGERPVASVFEVPKFTVFVLGMRGAGKTVFLASMYHHLLAYNEGRGYFVRCLDEQSSSELLDHFNELTAPDGWPEATQGSKKYIFECCYLPKDGSSPSALCRFTYFDYPGGYVLGQGSPTFPVRETARSADSILILLDGRKIKDLLDGRSSGDRTILQDIQAMAPILQDCVAARKPMHFLITKSDILNPRVQTLRRIQDALFAVEPFMQVLKVHSKYAAIHMAPVSSIGPNFAQYDNATGQMRKVSGATVRPYNVELSIALTMYDHLKAIADRLEPWVASQIEKGKIQLELLTALRRATDAVVTSPISVFLASNDIGIGIAVIQALKGFSWYLKKKRKIIDVAIKRMHESVIDQKSAFATVLSIQTLLVQRFEANLPDCNLSKRLTMS